MKAIISPSHINGLIQAPASKSAMQRACAAALIRKGRTILENPGDSADDLAALDIIKQLGATIIKRGDLIEISSTGVAPVSDLIHCGESGLSARMFTSIAALGQHELTVTGSGSLLKRPFGFFETCLPQLGVSVETTKGSLPLKLKGPLQPADITIDGQLSSQFLTGLLFAYAAAEAGNVSIDVKDLNSKPYIDLTLSVLESFGLKVPAHQDYSRFYFDETPVRSKQDPLHFRVEGDWSGAAFFLVAGAIAGELVLEGLDPFSLQADKAILQALMQAEVPLSITPERIVVKPGRLRAFHFNAVDCPDLFPPLVALAAYCEGISVIGGVQRLHHKESNRALTLKEEFGKMGVIIELQDDLMIISGSTGAGAKLSSHHDHRIAMACAVAALRAEGDTEIEGAEAVNKSYPRFWDHLRQVKAGVTLS